MAQVPAQRGQGGKMAAQRQYPVERLRRDFDNLFGRMFSDFLTPRLFGDLLSPFDRDLMRTPNVEVTESDNEIIVRAELPGFEENEIDVQLVNNVLTIRAEEEQRSERTHDVRRFFESIALPSGIDPDKVRAIYRNGVLELHIPRSEEARPRRIQIQGQGGKAQPSLTEQTGSPGGSQTQQTGTATAMGQSTTSSSQAGERAQEGTKSPRGSSR